MTTRALQNPPPWVPSFVDLLAGRADHVVLPIPTWASILPGRRRGRGMHARALLRWHVAGVRGHKLRTRRIGMRHICDGLSLRLFLEAVEAQTDGVAPVPTPRTTARRHTSRAAVAREAAARALGREVRR